jgi:hypothetical protein
LEAMLSLSRRFSVCAALRGSRGRPASFSLGPNIFVNDRWQVMVADFGLTRFAEATIAASASKLAGTPRLMAPELLDPRLP